MKHQISFLLVVALFFAGSRTVNAQTGRKPTMPDWKQKAEQNRQQREKIFAKLAEQKAQLQYEQKSFPTAVAQTATTGTSAQNNVSLTPAPAATENKAQANKVKSDK